MKISAVTTQTIAEYLRLDDFTAAELEPLMAAAKEYIINYTGLKSNELDDHEDLTVAYLILVQDMYDNRTLYPDKTAVGKTVETILGFYGRSLL